MQYLAGNNSLGRKNVLGLVRKIRDFPQKLRNEQMLSDHLQLI